MRTRIRRRSDSSFVVEDHDIDIRLVAGRSQRGNLAGANEGCGVRLLPLLQHAHDDPRACSVGEAGELVQRMIRIAAGGRSDKADERGALDV